MSESFIAVLTASLFSCLFATLGILTIWKVKPWANKSINYFMYFAAGILISAAILIAAPKAFEMNPNGPVFMLAGFLGIFIINRFIDVYVCHKRHFQRACRVGLVAAYGIAFHLLVDGIIYTTTYTVSIFLGAMATMGMIMHEYPEGVVTFSLIQKGGYSDKKAFIYAFLAAAATTPIGAVLSFPFISSLHESHLGILLGVTAGILAYVGASHLLPEAEREMKPYGIVAFALGILVAVGTWVMKGGLE